MLIQKSQAILKCFINPQELSIWFTLGLEDETMFSDTKACFKRRATAVLSWLDCSSTVA